MNNPGSMRPGNLKGLIPKAYPGRSDSYASSRYFIDILNSTKSQKFAAASVLPASQHRFKQKLVEIILRVKYYKSRKNFNAEIELI